MSDSDDRMHLPVHGDAVEDDRDGDRTDDLTGDRPDPAPVCRCIRTKMQYVTPGHPDGWERVSATAGYWCLHTMSSVGLDDRQATPRACRPGRACYETDD